MAIKNQPCKNEITVDNVGGLEQHVIKDIIGMTDWEIESFNEADLRDLVRQKHESKVDVYLNPDTFDYTIQNRKSNVGFDIRGVYPLMVNCVPTEDISDGVCYVRDKATGDVTKVVIEHLRGDKNSSVRHIHGLPVVNDNGDRLCFKNPKSGSNAVHIASVDETDDSKLSSSYTWSVCGFGSSRKSKENAIYVDEDDLTDDYITETDGNGGEEIVGKLCGRCQNSFSS